MKRVLGVVAATAAVLAFAVCGAATAVAPVLLKISIAESSGDIKGAILEEFAKKVTERTGGGIRFEIYYSNELGNLADVTEQIAMGANILSGTSGDFYADYGSADIGALALCYVLPTPESVNKFNESALFKKICDEIEASSGLKMLCMNWAAAPRSVLSTRPLRSVADFKGLKIRVPGAAAAAFFEALGAATESMPFSEIYTAMSQGILDACEAPLSTLYSYSLHEVAKNVYLSEHSLAPSCWAMSARIFNALPKEYQGVLIEELTRAGKKFTEQGLATQAEYREKMEAAGVVFTTPSDTDKRILQEAGIASFSAFPAMTPGLADQIADIIK